MYVLDMSEMPITDARAHLTELANRAEYNGESVYLTRHGKRVAALVPADWLSEIERVEDEIDNAAADSALAEGGAPIPAAQLWDQLGV